MYGFEPRHVYARPEAANDEESFWDGDIALIPVSPPYCQQQFASAKDLYEKVYPRIRPYPERTQYGDFPDLIVDEADELEKVYAAGDYMAPVKAVKMVRGTGRNCEWAERELFHRMGTFHRTKDPSTFRSLANGRIARKRSVANLRWSAYVRAAFEVARQVGYNISQSVDAACRILENIRWPRDLSDRRQRYSCKEDAIEAQLEVPATAALKILTNQQAAEWVFCCCAWLVHLQKTDPLSLPRKR